MLTLQKYVRKAFVVEAVEVTPDNIHEVAQWCGGEVRTSDLSQQGGQEGFQQYIKVFVKRPLNDRQTRAYYGDWVLSASTGFKVYSAKAFTSSFEKKIDHMMQTVQRMDVRAEQEETSELEESPGVTPMSFVDPVR